MLLAKQHPCGLKVNASLQVLNLIPGNNLHSQEKKFKLFF